MTEFARGRAFLTVDLGAVAANYRRLRREAPDAEIGGVVKADGYGLGATRVAATLRDAGCRRFFVAQLDEALDLRAVLPDAAIFVLNGLAAGALGEYVAARLTPVLNRPDEAESWAEAATALGRRLPAAIQFDTGMTRLGLTLREAEGLDPRAVDALNLRLVMSHLACADEPGHPMNALQRRRFDEATRLLPAAPRALANSAGIFLGGDYHYGLCRPGIALYGGRPTRGRPNPMRSVVTLTAPVIRVYEVKEAGAVGYGATRATRPGTRIATVPVGYADGVVRAAGNNAFATIDGRPVAYAGRISMDLITLDITSLPPGAVRPGTPVELIGGPDGVDDLASAAGTIPYEVLTRLGSRFARSYVEASVAEATP